MKHEITAKRLQKALDEAGLKPYQLADKSGVSQASISQYLNGSHKPSNISSGKMAEVLNVSPVWLMGFDVPQENLKDYTSKVANAFSGYTKLTDEALSVQRDIDDALSVARNVESMKPIEVYPPEVQRTKNKYEFALLQMYRELNDEGQNKLLSYADDLVQSNKYIKNSEFGDVEESS